MVEGIVSGTWMRGTVTYPNGLKIALKSVLETRCKDKEKLGWHQSQYGYAVRRSSVSIRGRNQPRETEMNHGMHTYF